MCQTSLPPTTSGDISPLSLMVWQRVMNSSHVLGISRPLSAKYFLLYMMPIVLAPEKGAVSRISIISGNSPTLSLVFRNSL